MTRLSTFYIVALFLMTFSALPLLSQTANAKFLMITNTGNSLSSVFDGREPNQQVRNTLILKTGPPDLRAPTIKNSFNYLLGITAGPSASACAVPSDICAQPGTTTGSSFTCDDGNGCTITVFNQAPDFNPCSGTFQEFACENCCVDWNPCDLCDTGGGDDPEPEVPPGPSPIIIDAEGEGFHLTSADGGVVFDIKGNGHPIGMAWTDSHYHNAFLVLPGPDGLVHNGKELFGNFTQQPPSQNPNGFIALALYDKPENGGNGNGMIDNGDSVFSRLRLWIDQNHDGICQPDELHKLADLGVDSIALDYTESRRTDQFGNEFRYKARVNPGDSRDATPSGDPGRQTYDVFFVVK